MHPAAFYFGIGILTLIGMTLGSIAIDLHKQNKFFACEAVAIAGSKMEFERSYYEEHEAQLNYSYQAESDISGCAWHFG